MTGINPITADCLGCGRQIETEFVTLLGQTFLAERYCVLCREASEKALRAMRKEGGGSMEVIAVVKEVTRKNIEPKNGGEPFTLYEIAAGDNVWTTKKQDIALTAHSLVGKTAMIEGSVRQNGKYTNYFINSIMETDAPVTGADVFGGSDIPTTNGGSSSRDEQIWRQTATKVAAQLADTPTDFWQNVDTLMNFYRTGVHPGQEEDYATVGTQTEGPDDDIPF